MREVFPVDLAEAASMGKFCLEKLPDVNKLKPAVWAKHEKNPESFGVSLGVRSFVRPLFIYVKLVQLRGYKYKKECLKLSDTKAFEAIKRGEMLTNSKYEKEKDPCASCRAFFGVLQCSSKEPTFLPFGNCAEYDVIQTANLDSHLNQIEEDWNIFQFACQTYFKAFKDLILSSEIEKENIQKYLEIKAQNSKILQFKQNGKDFELKVVNWPINKPNRKRRR